jgi:hypothetical protein
MLTCATECQILSRSVTVHTSMNNMNGRNVLYFHYNMDVDVCYKYNFETWYVNFNKLGGKCFHFIVVFDG